MKALHRFFKPSIPKQAARPKEWFDNQLKNSQIQKQLDNELVNQSQESVKVYYNSHYFNPEENECYSLSNSLVKIPAINIDGDRIGNFQNGLEFNNDFDFSSIPEGHPELLSPQERLAGGKKIIFSNSNVFATGGYPHPSPVVPLNKNFNVGIFSLAGANFENNYLHSRLFILDEVNNLIKNEKFSHLYNANATSYEEAKNILGADDVNESMRRIKIGLPFLLSRRLNGELYPSFTRSKAVIFLSEAYFNHQLEDVSLLLAAVNDAAAASGKKAYLKATAVGMGYFAKIDTIYDIQHLLFPLYLRAFLKLLCTHQYPNIAKIEFPLFDEVLQIQFDSLFALYQEPIGVFQKSRDVLEFTEEEMHEYYAAVVNPADTFSYSGNEWGYGSVEAMIGNNTSLRVDQVFHANPKILEPHRHIAVDIDPKNDFRAEIRASIKEQQSSLACRL